MVVLVRCGLEMSYVRLTSSSKQRHRIRVFLYLFACVLTATPLLYPAPIPIDHDHEGGARAAIAAVYDRNRTQTKIYMYIYCFRAGDARENHIMPIISYHTSMRRKRDRSGHGGMRVTDTLHYIRYDTIRYVRSTQQHRCRTV